MTCLSESDFQRVVLYPEAKSSLGATVPLCFKQVSAFWLIEFRSSRIYRASPSFSAFIIVDQGLFSCALNIHSGNGSGQSGRVCGWVCGCFGNRMFNSHLIQVGDDSLGKFRYAVSHNRLGQASLFRELSKSFSVTWSDEYSRPIFIAMSLLSSG